MPSISGELAPSGICFGVSAFAPQKAVADPTETFIDALKDYKAGNFKQSARKFESIAHKNIKNPDRLFRKESSNSEPAGLHRCPAHEGHEWFCSPQKDPVRRYNYSTGPPLSCRLKGLP